MKKEYSEMEGKIVLITGATSGIGKATAIGLTDKGASIIMTGRDKIRAMSALEEVKKKSNSSKIDMMIADLSSMSEVRLFAKDINRKYPKLDVLINNAGLITKTRLLTADGNDMQWAVNYFAPFLLTNLLLENLKRSNGGRIINVSAGLHQYVHINLSDLQGKNDRKYHSGQIYSRTKLALNMFTFELARRLQETNITVNCLHPGVVRTRLDVRAFSGIFPLFKPFFMSAEKGARTTIFLASSSDLDKVTGKYFVNKKSVKASKDCYDLSDNKKLWEYSAKIVGLK